MKKRGKKEHEHAGGIEHLVHSAPHSTPSHSTHAMHGAGSKHTSHKGRVTPMRTHPTEHTTHHEVASPKGYERTIKLLLENNVDLQKKLVDLTASIDEMNKRVGKLLDLIEKASEEFAGGEVKMPMPKEGMEGIEAGGEKISKGELIDKLEGLIRQNRTIARGLILLERFVREKLREGREETEEEEEFKPLPEFRF